MYNSICHSNLATSNAYSRAHTNNHTITINSSNKKSSNPNFRLRKKKIKIKIKIKIRTKLAKRVRYLVKIQGHFILNRVICRNAILRQRTSKNKKYRAANLKKIKCWINSSRSNMTKYIKLEINWKILIKTKIQKIIRV